MPKGGGAEHARDVPRPALEDLGEGHPGDVRVCFASRPYPNITFHDALFIDLSSQSEHGRDISAYIDDRLRIGESAMAVQIRKTIHAKAAGIFMWAILVVQDMNQEHDDGNVHRLQLHLDSVPATLHELYRHTLERYPESRDALLICFRGKLFSFDTLTSDQLWWGVQVGLGRDEDNFAEIYRQSTSLERARQIVSISRGLLVAQRFFQRLEYPATGDGTFNGDISDYMTPCVISFSHESVRDFLCKEAVHEARTQDDFVAQSHELLRDWCVVELRKQQSQAREISSWKNVANVGLKEQSTDWPKFEFEYPLAESAAEQVIRHSEFAQRHGRDQALFIRDLASHLGPSVFVRYGGASHFLGGRNALLQLLINTGCTSLIVRIQLEPARQARRSRKAFLIRPEIYPAPIDEHSDSRRYITSKSLQAVEALLKIHMELESRQPRLQQLLGTLLERWNPIYSSAHVVLSGAEPTLLELFEAEPPLATFFLLILAFPSVLDPHLDVLETLVLSDLMIVRDHRAPSSDRLRFLQIMQYFIEKGLRSDAINLEDPDLILWYRRHWGESYFDGVFRDVELSEECRITMADTEALLLAEYPNLAF
jgi:hypothetical protein